MNRLFYNDDILIQYEQQEMWEESVTYLAKLLHSDPQNKNVLYRLAAQCWYVLTFWDCNMPKESLHRNFFESNLKSVYLLAREQWWSDPDCLWLFGYFMSINQLDFLFVSADIRDVEKVGCNLIHQSILIDPNNKPAQILYLADNAGKHKYINAKKKMKESISALFPGEPEVDKYFAEVFTCVC